MRGKSVNLFVSIVFVIFAAALISLPALASHITALVTTLSPNNNAFIKDTYLLNATTDISVNNASFYFYNSTYNTPYYNNTTSGKEFTYSLDTATISDGVYDIRVLLSSGDTVSHTSITIDNNPPLVDIIDPTSMTYNSLVVPLNYTATDTVGGVDKCWYILNGVTNDLPSCANTTMTGIERDNWVIVYANDTAGNENSSANVSFTIDTTAPTITLLSPENITYNYRMILINSTVTDLSGVSIAIAEINGTDNFTLVDGFSGEWYHLGYVFAEGTNTLRIFANDTVGNEIFSSSVTFIVDATDPELWETAINDTLMRNGDAFLLAANITDNIDTNLTVTADIINSTGSSFGTLTLSKKGIQVYGTESTFPTAPSGTYIFNITITDFAGNSIWDDSTSITLDNDAPILTNLAPSGEITDTTPDLYLNTNENATCRFNTANISYENMTNFAITGTKAHSNPLGTLEEGDYEYYVRCADVLGNIGEGKVSFTVEKSSPGGGGPSGNPILFNTKNNTTTKLGTTTVPEQSFTGGTTNQIKPQENNQPTGPGAGPTGAFVFSADATTAASIAASIIVSTAILWFLFRREIKSVMDRISWRHY